MATEAPVSRAARAAQAAALPAPTTNTSTWKSSTLPLLDFGTVFALQSLAMGDRFDRLKLRHANVETLLRRPGIGHNNGPTFDMSWEAWVWRRATTKAWKTPNPEVARMRVRRAERLGITYRELTAALMDTGVNLGAAVLPLSLATRLRRGPKGEIVVEPRN